MNNYSKCLVVGSSGVGKSSFINAITKSKECEVSGGAYNCTMDLQLIYTEHDNYKYIFVDTPDFDNPRGDGLNIQSLKSISNNPKIKCIILVMPFNHIRVTNSMIQNIKKLIEWFPVKQFWEHVFIVRTRSPRRRRGFDEEIENIEGSFFKNLNSSNDLKKFITEKKIANIPSFIDEFYVNCPGEENDYKENEEEFCKIFKKLKNINTYLN